MQEGHGRWGHFTVKVVFQMDQFSVTIMTEQVRKVFKSGHTSQLSKTEI